MLIASDSPHPLNYVARSQTARARRRFALARPDPETAVWRKRPAARLAQFLRGSADPYLQTPVAECRNTRCACRYATRRRALIAHRRTPGAANQHRFLLCLAALECQDLSLMKGGRVGRRRGRAGLRPCKEILASRALRTMPSTEARPGMAPLRRKQGQQRAGVRDQRLCRREGRPAGCRRRESVPPRRIRRPRRRCPGDPRRRGPRPPSRAPLCARSSTVNLGWRVRRCVQPQRNGG